MDEATFREIQEKKLEIYNAIVKLQKGDGNDEKLQVFFLGSSSTFHFIILYNCCLTIFLFVL
jgi:hypothetical protein